MNSNFVTPRASAARRAALWLSMSALMLAGLAGCGEKSSSTDGRSTTTTTTTMPAASAASR